MKTIHLETVLTLCWKFR